MKPNFYFLRYFFVFLGVILAFSNVLGQRAIKGIVQDLSNQEPLIGANIVIDNDNSRGTITDFDGNFELSVGNDTKKITVSYTGYTSVTVNLDARNFYQIELAAGKILDDVIVIGYGTVKREDATGSIQAVSSKDFNRGAITSPQELLAGKVAGVAISTTGGGPDDAVQIRVRGQSSLSASSDPLIVIDGIPVENNGVAGNRNPLNIINPNDIETMTVLKDASATAIYGSRASGGVILITTKKGALGSPFKIGYSGNFSVGQTSNRLDVLRADEYRDLINATFDENHPSRALMGTANTDWQDEIYRSAIGQDHNLSLSGSLGFIPYRASLGYTNKQGLLLNDHFNRYSLGINVTPKFLDNRLQTNFGVKAALNNNQFAERGAIGAAASWDPTQSPFDSNNRFGGYTTWLQPNGNPNQLAPSNPVALLDRNLRNDRSDVQRYITNASFDYRFESIPALRANLNLGYDYSKGNGSVFIPGNNSVPFSFQPDFGGGVDNSYEQTRTNSLLEFYLNYKKSIEKHDLDFMGGYSYQRFYDEINERRSDAAGTPALTNMINQRGEELILISLFGRANYSYDRYLLTFTMRGDATSRFSGSNRWGLFPAAAFAVKMIENDNKYFNNVKGRLGWGVTGQQAIGTAYESRATYETNQIGAFYQFGDTFYGTVRPRGYDANIKWEETVTYNIGFDYSLIKNRLSGTLDLYQRNTKDLLNFVVPPAGSNLTNQINTNVGSMVNKGIELGLNATAIDKKDMTWDIGFNAAYNTNEITKLTLTDDPNYQGVLTGGISGGVGSNIQIHSVGFQPASFFVYQQLYDENGKIIVGQFADINGDGIVNEDDRIRYQKPAPDYIMGITSNFKYKNFDFSFAGRANIGNYIYNNVQTDMGYLQRLYHPTDYLQNIHRAGVTNNALLQRDLIFSNHFVRDASFFRMDHITMGYSIPKLIGSFTRVYMTLQNAFVLTKYDGLDPEIPNGIDNSFYPRPRTFVFGVSVDF